MRSAQLESSLAQVASRIGLKGYAAAVSSNGNVTWSTASGPADRTGRPLRADTLFQLASLTKPIAAVVIMRLVERGLLDLDTPARDLISAKRSAQRDMVRKTPGISVRHLLGHSAGLPGLALGRRRPVSPPGAEFRYSGSAFSLLTDVAETVGEGTFAAQVAKEVITPCDLHDTYLDTTALADAGRSGNLALPVGRKGLFGLLLRPRDTLKAASGLVSTTADYLKFDAALASGTLLAPDTLSAAWTAQELTTGVRSPHGLGFFVQSIGSEPVRWHAGYQPGYHSSVYASLPERNVAFVVLSNTDAIGRDGRLGRGDLTRSSVAMVMLEAVTGLLRD